MQRLSSETARTRSRLAMIHASDTAEFCRNYPDDGARLQLAVQSELFSSRRLIELAQTLDEHLVEFNPGDLPIAVAPNNIPHSDLSAAEIIESIGTNNSWMTLRNIEHDLAFERLMRQIIDVLKPDIEERSGPIIQCEGFLFISSPGAVTPFHFDEEHNVLIQLRGRKRVALFSQHDRDLASQIDLERFHSGGHRNLALPKNLENRGDEIALEPGAALYIPPLAPHWVSVTGTEPSLSLSVTWRSHASRRMCYLHQINHELRKRGANPRFPGTARLIDQLKIWCASGANRLKSLFRP